MRSFQLHIPSVALGLAACAVLFVSMSQVAPQLGPPRVEYGPNPRDMVQIKEGTPYTVPAGAVFVLTALGTSTSSSSIPRALLKVNGQIEVVGGMQIVTDGGGGVGMQVTTSVGPAPIGFTVPAGAVIDVDDQSSTEQRGRAWGYLSR